MEGFKGVIFSDMDGTLIDHDTYDWSPANKALSLCRENDIPIILASSKTRAELLLWQKKLHIKGPIISENGGGVFLTGFDELIGRFPDQLEGTPAKIFCKPIGEVREALRYVARNSSGKITHFETMSTQSISIATGLSLEEAELAAQREFDEPFTWLPEPLEAEVGEVRNLLASRGVTLTRGGRFWHVMGGCDKGVAVRWVMDNLFPGVPALAVGDSANDFEMLIEADRGLLVEKSGGGHLETRPLNLEAVSGVGPVGWNRGVLSWLAGLGIIEGEE